MTPEMLRERPIRRLISETAGVYLQALDDKSIQYEIPAEMRQSLEQDIFVFSGFKTYHQLKEASELLRDSQGRVKSFNQFYQDVSAIRNKYNRNWLHAEYNFAVSSAQMASHWAEYQQDEEMANLQYRTALDDKVRPEHAALEGVTLPMSDPFWDTAFPPNGWNCRCHVIPVLKEDFPLSNSQRAQDAFDDMTQGKASIFRYNPGKEGVIFPPHHPYYGKRGYKHCLNPHLATSLGDNLECEIHGELEGIDDLKQEQVRAKENIDQCKKEIDKYNGVIVESGDSVASGSLILLRGSLNSIREHAYTDISVQRWLSKITPNTRLDARYIGWGEVRYKVDKSGALVRKHPEAELFTYYEITLEGKPYYINAKAHRRYDNKEVIYTIEPKRPDDLQLGLPDIYKK
ncbi:phage minor head protein [Porphyromonas sp.]|uniref:phage head morphogenesis protein n=1 Tax=Porphyromonas sp. TaxID=1924944 RepID=UPI003AB09B4F